MMIYGLIISIVVVEYLFGLWLKMLNVRASRREIPSSLRGVYDEEKYARQQAYFRVKSRFGLIESTVSTLVMLAMFACGGFAWIDTLAREWVTHPIGVTLVFFALVQLLLWVLELPMAYYNTFVIEERFGFNKSTRKTFVTDSIKSLLLNFVLMGLLLAAVTWIYYRMPQYFWLLAWGVMAVFMLFLQVFYSDLIVPLFNKQTPLAEGTLRTAIEQFAAKAGFKVKDIYIMDGSKRSSHANAYFAGFGPRKRIVLFDTLIEQLTTEEIVGVLAHEIGHNKRHHLPVSIAFSLLTSLVMLYLFSLVIGSPSIAAAAGCAQPSFHINLIVFSMLYAPLNVVLDMLLNVMSRRHEWQADEFARVNGLGKEVSSALKKMSAHSLSNLTPHPWVVFMTYSHPTLYQRVLHLESEKEEV